MGRKDNTEGYEDALKGEFNPPHNADGLSSTFLPGALSEAAKEDIQDYREGWREGKKDK